MDTKTTLEGKIDHCMEQYERLKAEGSSLADDMLTMADEYAIRLVRLRS